jgi:predicted amidophosphoribosyltransferase
VICPRCGSWIDEGESYCPDCGYDGSDDDEYDEDY